MTNVDKYQLVPLIRKALSGDASAWNDFFGGIRKFLHAELAKGSPDAKAQLEHSDIVQSALRRIWEGIEDQFPNGPEDIAIGRFLGWISQIARNRRVEEWRKRERNRNEGTGSGIERVSDPRPQDRAVKNNQLAVEVAAALASLPEKQRQVVELFWFEGLSDSEISERLGCNQGSVRVIRYRALEKLQYPKLRSLLEESHESRY